MVNIKIPDADGLPKYIASTGTGSNDDPILLRRAVDGIGEVQANPTANTLLARIKSLEDKLADVKTAVEALAVASPDTAAGDMADINIASASIDGKLPAIGQQLKAASLSIVPASDADDVKVTLDSESVTVTGIAPATVTGTCAAAYATALSLACSGIRNKTIVVVNTDAALTMKYRIRGFAKSGSSYYNEIQAEATLAASTSQPHVIENSYDVITVEVIDGTGHATYAIDYCGGQ